MTGMIGAPFELHGIQVGPSLPDAQLQQGSRGLYVATLQSWLWLFVENTGVGVFPDRAPADPADALFGDQTRLSVQSVQALAGQAQTGRAETELWIYLEQQLVAPTFPGARGVLPPTPLERIPEFPERGTPEYANKLRLGLETFGFRFSSPADAPDNDELSQIVATFQRLALAQPAGVTPNFIGNHFADQSFWRKQWRDYRRTWGRFFGAPWLGIIIDETSLRWGAHSLIANLYQVGEAYLRSATSADELMQMLRCPIHIHAIADRLGDRQDREIRYPGEEPTMTIKTPRERTFAPKWLRAYETASSGIAVVGDREIKREYLAGPVVHDGRLHMRVGASKKVASERISWVQASTYESYQSLGEQWENDFDGRTGDELFLHRTNVYVGAYLPRDWALSLPNAALSIVNGAVARDHARALLLLRNAVITRMTLTDGPAFVREVVAIPASTQQTAALGIDLLRIELADLQADRAYVVSVNYLLAGVPRATTWEFQTLPATTPSTGFSFIAASCYSDFGIRRGDGRLADGAPAGANYLYALRTWMQQQPFFAPRFKVLMGDNVYLDVAPDFIPSGSMLDAMAETTGRYVRYWMASEYKEVLKALPTFAIADDHEYWNDYPRPQLQLRRTRADFANDYAAAARVSLRAFQGAFTPLARQGATHEPNDVEEFTYQWKIEGGDGCPISFFFFDTTSTRKYTRGEDKPAQLAADHLVQQLCTWAQNLTSPGILVIGQPLLVPQYYSSIGGLVGDYHPSSFIQDFRKIMEALIAAPWDVAILTGDVHWSRIVEADLNLYVSSLYHDAPQLGQRLYERYQPRMVEVVSSPAQRLPANLQLASGSYSKPNFDPPQQIYATAPWAKRDETHLSSHRPRVHAASYESPFASVRCQPIHDQAMRVDISFIDKRGKLLCRDPDSATTAPTGGLRWLLPNEWVTVNQLNNELWRDYDPGDSAVQESVRPFYPYGVYRDDEDGVLPPRTTGAQFVRWLVPDERLFVKRVLFQSRRVLRDDGIFAYQCVEVATTDPRDATFDYGAASDASYFVWAIYRSTTYLAPSKEHLNSVILRKRLPWFEAGDRIETSSANNELWDQDHITFPQPKERYEYGEIAHAPFTGTRLRFLEKNEKGTVVRVYFQAEQVYLESQSALKGAYQLLEVEMDEGGPGGHRRGVVWSVYDGVEWVKRIERHATAERKQLLEQWQRDDLVHWLRRSSAQFPNQYWAAARLDRLLADPTALQPLEASFARETVFLQLWLQYRKPSFVKFVANLYEHHRYILDERFVSSTRPKDEREAEPFNERGLAKELRIGDRRIHPPLALRRQSLDRLCVGAAFLAIHKLSASDLAVTLKAALGGLTKSSTSMTPATIPDYLADEQEVLILGSFAIAGTTYPALLLRSTLLYDGQRVRFTYWPDANNLEAAADLDAATFFAAVTGVISWRPLATHGPAATGDTLHSGRLLAPGGTLTSPNGTYQLTLRTDGNLVLYRKHASGALWPLWESGTSASRANACVLQSDGILTLLDPDARVAWTPAIPGDPQPRPGSRLVIQDDGDLVLYDSNSKPLWRTQTRALVVHWKTLIPIDPQVTSFIAIQFEAMEQLFLEGRVNLVKGTTEDLSPDPALAALAILDVGSCDSAATPGQRLVFAERNHVGAGDLVIYVARRLTGSSTNLAGCAVHPPGTPGAVIAHRIDDANWVTAHEVGHVLGLGHTSNPKGLMHDSINWEEPPPDLSASEYSSLITAIRALLYP